MNKVIHSWLAFGLSLGVFASCSQDGSEPSSASEGGERVSLSLRAEVSVEDPSLRAIDYKLGENSKGQLVPMPQFADKQEVDVHTVLKSSNGTVVAKTLKWRYDATKKKLVLSPTNSDITQDTNNIVVSGFNNDGGTKWYISGLIGGTLTGTQVRFEGSRELRGATSAGDAVGSLEVPYAFAWTELTINTESSANTRDGNGSYKYAGIPTTSGVKFSPQGSLIGYKLGTNQKAGAYTFTPSGFTVSSNAFGDQGTFELNTAVPTASSPTAALPSWTEDSASALVYSFASGQEPGTIAHEQTADKTYYAWVMPHKTQPTAVETRVMFRGTSSRPETNGFKDYSKTWYTDYAPKASQLTQGRVHQLRANASYPLYLPIQYVTDYNLAGGEGLTYVVGSGTSSGRLNGPVFGGVQPVGVTGELRFADSHSNDVSGYYNWTRVNGRHHAVHNTQTRSLQTEVDATFGAGKYYIPEAVQWGGIFPQAYDWINNRRVRNPNSNELMAYGPSHDLIRLSYHSDYSTVISVDEENEDAYVYAIRFKARPASLSPMQDLNYVGPGWKRSPYPSAPDNLVKCAYRFHRVGGRATWQSNSTGRLTNRLDIDVVYLGEEAVPTTLDQISDNAWWLAKEAEGSVISKTFPATGHMNVTEGVSRASLSSVGAFVRLWSTTLSGANSGSSAYIGSLDFTAFESELWNTGAPVRLFKHGND